MNNPDSYETLLREPREKKSRGPLLAKLALGLLLVVFFFKVGGWNAGCAALIILLPVGIARGPARFRRLLTVLYLVFVVMLVSGSIIQSRLASEAMQRLAERNALVRFFVGGLAEQIVVSTVLGLLLGLLVVGIPLLSIMLASSEFVLALHEVFGVDRKTALRYLLGLIMGIQLPWEIVEDGKRTQAKPPGILNIIGGPGLLVIRPGNAVVLEVGGEVTRIEGPGVFRTNLYERVRKVVDLRPLWHTVKAEKVLTQDRIPLTFELRVGYQLEPKPDTDQRGAMDPTIPAAKGEIQGAYPVYKESIYRAVFKLDPATPEEAVKANADAFLRDEVGTYNLDDLYDYSMADTVKARGNAILEIEAAVNARLERALEDWGLKLLGADISTVETPEDVKARILDWWVTAWQKETTVAEATGESRAMVERGKGQAEALETVESKKELLRERLTRQLLDIVRATAGVGVELDATVAVRLVSVIEAVSTRMTCDSPTALKYLDALEKLLQSEGDKTLIVGESPPLLIKGEGQREG